ncbi:hypothetical protein MJN69_29105, partial [Salmonella enterica subsp. enterica serovar Kentucky]|nr:hypothetical protein [Salmonella enterica subsp. enterica serovar Kentucky]
LIGSALTGTLLWEWINPVSLLGRSLIMGFSSGALLIIALFLFLYIRLYPNKTLDVIGIDIDNFTRTVVRENCMEIHTKYVNMPM